MVLLDCGGEWVVRRAGEAVSRPPSWNSKSKVLTVRPQQLWATGGHVQASEIPQSAAVSTRTDSSLVANEYLPRTSKPLRNRVVTVGLCDRTQRTSGPVIAESQTGVTINASCLEYCESALVTTRVVVIGGGGFGREVLELIADINDAASSPTFAVVGVLDDAPTPVELLTQLGTSHLGPVAALRDLHPDVQYVIGIGACAPREAIDRQCLIWQRKAASLVHPTAVIGRRSVHMGPGSIVCAHSTITSNIRLGRQVQVNPNSSIGHDTTLGDYVTLTPQAAVAGNVSIGNHVFVGTGARIKPGVTIADGVLIGAGAVVVHDGPPT